MYWLISKNKGKKYLKQQFEFLLLAGLVTIYFVWFAWPLIWSASESIRLVSVFSLDERLHARLLEIAIEEASLNIEFYNYGHLYFYVSLLPLLVSSYFLPVSEQAIIVSLRLVTTVFAIGTVLITFVLAKRFFGRLTAWLSACLLMILPLNFLIWSVTSHPDIPQLFFVVLSIYFCLRLAQEGHWKWLVWASVAAGLAFPSKYSGMFLLPIVWLVIIIQDNAHPVIPFLIILAMNLVNELFYYISSKISKKYVSVLAIGIVLFIGGLEFPSAFDHIVDFRNSIMNREQANIAVAAGEWLLATYPPSMRILYDDYSYVPPQFSNVHLSPWTGETISVLNRLNPDLVIVSQVKARRFSNPDRAGDYEAGEHKFMGRYEYYKQLENRDLGYYLIKDFGEIQVYARQ